MWKKDICTYLRSSDFDRIPIEARKDILEKCGVVIYFLAFELGVAEVEGEREWGGFAGFDGAGEEIYC